LILRIFTVCKKNKYFSFYIKGENQDK